MVVKLADVEFNLRDRRGIRTTPSLVRKIQRHGQARCDLHGGTEHHLRRLKQILERGLKSQKAVFDERRRAGCPNVAAYVKVARPAA